MVVFASRAWIVNPKARRRVTAERDGHTKRPIPRCSSSSDSLDGKTRLMTNKTLPTYCTMQRRKRPSEANWRVLRTGSPWGTSLSLRRRRAQSKVTGAEYWVRSTPDQSRGSHMAIGGDATSRASFLPGPCNSCQKATHPHLRMDPVDRMR